MNFASTRVYLGDSSAPSVSDEEVSSLPMSAAAPLEQRELSSSSSSSSSSGGFFKRLFGKKDKASPPPPPAPLSSQPNDMPAPSSSRVEGGAAAKQVDTNVLSLKFDALTEVVSPCVDAPAHCQQCNAVFHSSSELLNNNDNSNNSNSEGIHAPGGPQAQGDNNNSNEHEQKQGMPNISSSSHNIMLPDLDPGQQAWKCEFCKHINISNQPLNAQSQIDFLLERAPPSVASPSSSEPSSSDAPAPSPGLLVFCVDISGSMCVSTAVTGQLQGRLRQRAMDPALTFDDMPPAQRSHVQYISRLQSLQIALDKQLTTLAEKHPDKRVLLITFNSAVEIRDGVQEVVRIEGDILNNEDDLIARASSYRVQNSLSSNRDALIDDLYELEEGGPTALGPALVMALSLCASHPASSVVVCTDGLANVGLGAMDSVHAMNDQVAMWYEYQGERARDAGTVVSVLSIIGDECKLENLGRVAELSGGNVDRINPKDLTSQIQHILAKPTLATNVSCLFIAVKGLVFRHEEQFESIELDQNNPGATSKNQVKKRIGNVTSDTEILLSYGIENMESLSYFEKLKTLPFQVQICFTALNGARYMRVITANQDITFSRADAERDVAVEVLGAHVAQTSAKLASMGLFKKARAHWRQFSPMMERVGAQSQPQQRTLHNYQQHIQQFDASMAVQQQQEIAAGGDRSDSDDEASQQREKKSAAPLKFKRKAAVKDETYAMMNQSCRLNSAGLL